MTSVIALLCAITLAPSDCTRDSAVDVVPLPDAANEFACAMSAQMTLAQLAVRADSGHRWVIKCGAPDHGENVAGVNDP